MGPDDDIDTAQSSRVSVIGHARRRPWRAALFVIVALTVLVTLGCLAFPWWVVSQSEAALTRSLASHITPSANESCMSQSNGRYECSMEVQGDYSDVAAPFYYDVRVRRGGCWTATLDRSEYGHAPSRTPERIEDCIRAWHYLD